MNNQEIRQQLIAWQDEPYAAFQRKLLPTVNPDTIIGVRTPILRRYAKQLINETKTTDFLNQLPHDLFEENQLHAFLLSETKDFDTCINRLVEFLPHIDNWATCDQLSPKCFKRHHCELLPYITQWINSEPEYTVRFAIGMLMLHFLDDDFTPLYPEWVASVRRDEYYIRMMQAWYFATALAKQTETSLPYLKNHRLDKWTHNKTIQKAIESYRIPDGLKRHLRTLKL